jgi:hypothetical protein
MEDSDGRKHQVCAYIRLHDYPARWCEVIRNSLTFFIDQGAVISWAGGWECFLHYTPAVEFDGCYAAYTASTGLICAGGLDDPQMNMSVVPRSAARLHEAVRQAVEGRQK